MRPVDNSAADAPADWLRANNAYWDERVPIHTAGPFYDLDGFREHPDVMRAFEAEEVGDVTGKSLLHLQCHIGLDTLSWAHRGAARVVGLDFSAPAVEAAGRLAAELGYDAARAEFVTADVHDAPSAVPDPGGYDVVYTGVGALCWLPDLRRWAAAAAACVAPGGFLYVAEFHPVPDMLDWDTGTTVSQDYFNHEIWIDDAPGTYADRDAATVNNRNAQWQHTLGEVVSAVAATGLRVDFLHEHDFTLFQRLSTLEERDGRFRLPSGRPRIPLMYSLRASRV